MWTLMPKDPPTSHADLVFLKAQVQRGNILHHVRRLATLIDGESRFADVPVGHDRARFQSHPGVPSEDEVSLHHLIRVSKGLVGGSGFVHALEGKIVAQDSVNNRRLPIQRRFHISHRLKFFVFDCDRFRRIFRQRAAGRHNGSDGFALPASAIDGNRMLRRRFEALQMGEHADPGRNDCGKLSPRYDGDDTRHLLCRCRVDGRDFRVRMR